MSAVQLLTPPPDGEQAAPGAQSGRRRQPPVVDSLRPIDPASAERAVADLLTALGQDVSSEHLRDDPGSRQELFACAGAAA